MNYQMIQHMQKYHEVMDPLSTSRCVADIKRGIEEDVETYFMLEQVGLRDTSPDMIHDVTKQIQDGLEALRLARTN